MMGKVEREHGTAHTARRVLFFFSEQNETYWLYKIWKINKVHIGVDDPFLAVITLPVESRKTIAETLRAKTKKETKLLQHTLKKCRC